MNHAFFRSKYKGQINKIAYIGMLGDLATIGILYVLWNERKKKKLAELPKKKAAEIERNL